MPEKRPKIVEIKCYQGFYPATAQTHKDRPFYETIEGILIKLRLGTGFRNFVIVGAPYYNTVLEAEFYVRDYVTGMIVLTYDMLEWMDSHYEHSDGTYFSIYEICQKRLDKLVADSGLDKVLAALAEAKKLNKLPPSQKI